MADGGGGGGGGGGGLIENTCGFVLKKKNDQEKLVPRGSGDQMVGGEKGGL